MDLTDINNRPNSEHLHIDIHSIEFEVELLKRSIETSNDAEHLKMLLTRLYTSYLVQKQIITFFRERLGI